jgi:taurine---2-oxoglutarate transaminase
VTQVPSLPRDSSAPSGAEPDVSEQRDEDIASPWDRERAAVFHSWSAQNSLDPLMVSRASGVHVYDDSGREYLDFSSQLVNTNIGHQHPVVVSAIKAQADVLCTIAPQHGTEARFRAGELVLSHSFANASKVFFTTGGTEAVEHAVRMARLHTGRPKILSAYRSYHGATAMSINLTGDPRRWAIDSGTAGVARFFGPFLYRSEFGATTREEESERALTHLEHTIGFEGPATIAAIILETIPGTAGVIEPPPGYLAGVRSLCDRFGILLILDEVMAGFGRAGEWFAYDAFDVVPDLVTFAKGVNSGYVPLGGVILSAEIAATFGDRPYPGGLTYSGHPLACAAAVATMTAMADEGIIENARSIGTTVLGPGLRDLAVRHPSVGDVRGRGVFFAIELVSNRETREPLAPYGSSSDAMAAVIAECRNQGLLIFANHNRLHAVPPCIITKEQVEDGLTRLGRALDVADRWYSGA